MSKFFRSEYVFFLVVFLLLAGFTFAIVKMAPAVTQTAVTAFYASFIVPMVSAFVSKSAKDKVSAPINNSKKEV